jgi:hypothetical protein
VRIQGQRGRAGGQHACTQGASAVPLRMLPPSPVAGCQPPAAARAPQSTSFSVSARAPGSSSSPDAPGGSPHAPLPMMLCPLLPGAVASRAAGVLGASGAASRGPGSATPAAGGSGAGASGALPAAAVPSLADAARRATRQLRRRCGGTHAAPGARQQHSRCTRCKASAGVGLGPGASARPAWCMREPGCRPTEGGCSSDLTGALVRIANDRNVKERFGGLFKRRAALYIRLGGGVQIN